MATGTSASNHGTSATVGEKLFYKIGEVSRLTGLPAYVLRFWESEFGFLRPQKTRGRQRKYTPKDIETLLQIKRMRYEQGFTLEGLRRRWHTRAGTQERRPSRDTVEVVRRVKHEVHEMLKVLSDST
jgi:DNA-binding transcriptional MerR regulator